MSFQNSTIKEVWDITKGSCMICGKKLSWKNRGKKVQGAHGKSVQFATVLLKDMFYPIVK